VNEGEETWVVRVNGGVSSLDDLRHIGVKNVAGVVITVGDVARVELGEMTRYGAVTQDGKGEAVEGLVIGLKGVNAGD
jgi:cobalt-zinc-cadmium resistance protein CzcA